MKVSEILKSSDRPLVSLEVYPPKVIYSPTGPPIQQHLSSIFNTVEHLKKYRPAFVSVTYNPEGQTKTTSIPLAAILKQKYRIEPVAHLTCIATPGEELKKTLDVIDYFGIDNILALRGDRPKNFTPFPDGLSFASELVEAIKAHEHDFSIGVAAYPEGHPECTLVSGERDLERDLENFKGKVDRGANFAITQLFLDNQLYFDHLEKARKLGIEIPILPGIMPVVSYGTLRTVKRLCGAAVPASFEQRVRDNRGDPQEIFAMGIEHAVRQCKGLVDKTPCIHFYTMDMWEPVESIIEGYLG